MMLHNNETQEAIENGEQASEEAGSYIGNLNTGVYHNPDCFCIGMMNEENKKCTDNMDAGFRPCAHCKPDLHRQLTFDYLLQLEKHAIPCTDEDMVEVFGDAGCKKDGKHEGIVRMYPDNQYGIKVQGKPGLWRVYFECNICGVKTWYFEAETMLKIKDLVQLDVRERLEYGKPLIDRKHEIQELMGVIA